MKPKMPDPDLRQTIGNPCWLFVGDNYYPSGGMGDFAGAFRSLPEAIDFLNRHKHPNDPWAEVFLVDDATTIRLVRFDGGWRQDNIRTDDG